MKQLFEQLDARLRRAASRLDAASAMLGSWSVAFPAMSVVKVNNEQGVVAIRTATDVHARRLQEPPP